LAVLGVGCTKADMTHTRFTPTDLAPKDAITVIFFDHPWGEEYSAILEERVAGCIRDGLENTHPTVRIVPPEKFRQAAFPGLPPEEIPPGHWPWDQLVDDPAFRERIAPLGLHYLIAVSGGTRTDWIYSGGFLGPFFTLDNRLKRHSRLQATVLDLKQGSKAGGFWVDAYDKVGTLIAPTETRACRELGEGVAKFLAGEKPPEETEAEQLEETPAKAEEGATSTGKAEY